jgi:hypothetical protein
VLPSTTSNYIIHILTQNRYLMYVVVPGEKEERKRKKEKEIRREGGNLSHLRTEKWRIGRRTVSFVLHTQTLR